jgi:ABC-type bacteriocin/lantibiotic exporter with double-glycine peptidase domain
MADRDHTLDQAVDRLARGDGGHPAPHRADPLDDALSVAAAAIGGSTRPADPEVEAGLPRVDAAVTASGLLAWRVDLAGRWWRAVTGPLLVRTRSGPAAVVPSRRGDDIVDGVTRHTRRLTPASAREVEEPALALARDLPSGAHWWQLLAWSLGQHRGDVWLLLALGVIGGFAGLLLPLATGAIFESAVPAGDAGRVVAILVAFAVASAGAGVLVLVRGLLVVRIRDRSDSVLGPSLAAQLLRLPAAFFRRRPAGDIVNRALSVDAARQQVDDSVLAALVTAAFGLVSIVYLLAADIAVGLASAVATLIVLGASVYVQLRARKLLPQLLEARSRSDATLLGLLGSLVVWRVAGAEDRALARWASDQGRSTRALDVRLGAVSLTGPTDVAGPLLIVLLFVATVVLLPGAKLQPGSPSAPGVFLALYAAVAQLALAVMALSNQLVVVSELGPVLSRAEPITATARERGPDVPAPGRLGGGIGLSRVVFGYRQDQPPLLDGVDLAVSPGEFVAVVGPSGGGKSTVVRLLLGFERPWEGSITYDGRDLDGLDAAAVRRQLGVVLQASRPLGTTVRECVTGPREMDDDEVWDLLERSGLSDDVREMPGRLAAPVGAHGRLLSGGQRQRLMIAGALAGRPRILLLDEATSALDTVTQAVVMRTVLSSTATRVVVAHRMSTIRDADRVVVVADGGIAEEGRPDELLAAGGHFARLAGRQQA